MPGDDLARRVGLLLQAVRARSGLSPEQVAEAAETSQQWVSRVERGTVGVRLRDAQRLFAAVGARLLVQSAPLGAGADDPDLVGDGADEALETAFIDYRYALRTFARVPYVVEGRLAALMQVLPVRPTRLDLAVRESDLDEVRGVLGMLGGLRWSERWQEFREYDVDPARPGPRRWRISGLYELRLTVAPTLPQAITVQVGSRRSGSGRLPSSRSVTRTSPP
jgi:transcriptional regulator with XRE-family HTH domain